MKPGDSLSVLKKFADSPSGPPDFVELYFLMIFTIYISGSGPGCTGTNVLETR